MPEAALGDPLAHRAAGKVQLGCRLRNRSRLAAAGRIEHSAGLDDFVDNTTIHGVIVTLLMTTINIFIGDVVVTP